MCTKTSSTIFTRSCAATRLQWMSTITSLPFCTQSICTPLWKHTKTQNASQQMIWRLLKKWLTSEAGHCARGITKACWSRCWSICIYTRSPRKISSRKLRNGPPLSLWIECSRVNRPPVLISHSILRRKNLTVMLRLLILEMLRSQSTLHSCNR